MAFLFGLQDTLLDFFEKGGGVVVFIGFLIILMWSFILERFWYFKYIHGDVEKDIQNAWKGTPDRKSWSGHQIRSMLISKANVKIPAGTQSGKQLRLKSKGMPMLRSSGFGDLYLQIKVETPISLNKEQKELLEKFRKLEDSKNNPENQSFFKKAKKFWENIN